MGLRSFTILAAGCAVGAAAALGVARPAFAEAALYVRVQQSGGGIHEVPLEAYVESAVASETYADWPRASLQAQAVVARTYALYERKRNRERRYDVESTVISQRYGVERVTPPIRKATRDTAGRYLAHDGAPILAVFHSAGGGRTATSEEVWGKSLPYLRSVESPDDEAPDHFWSYSIPTGEFFKALRESGVRTTDGPIEVTRRSPSGRVLLMRAGETVLSGRDVRDLLGGRACGARSSTSGSRRASWPSSAAAPATGSGCRSGGPESSPGAVGPTNRSWRITIPAPRCAASARNPSEGRPPDEPRDPDPRRPGRP